ncbi:hypothetical protein niasHT_006124 [Heterodera trifolii]|uniref:Uncharacterized protein n=1 Tax=Heterodera trifolii TaxID=157864 RepID=A0ABD2M6K3_9BILA
MIKAQFDEKQFDGLALKVEKKEEFGTELEVTPKEKIVEFCGKLAKMRQISEQNIEKYESEVPFKRNIVIKQKENYAKFYEFLILVAKYFGGKVFKSAYAGEKLQIELNGANELLDKMYEMAKMVKSGEELNFKKAIRKILDKKLDENLEILLNQFEEPTEFIIIPYKSAEKRKEIEQKYPHKQFVEAQLFNLLFSFAVRLEAIVHGKKEDGTIEEEENAEKEDGTIEEEENAEKAGGEKIQTFLAVLGKFNLPERANNFR